MLHPLSKDDRIYAYRNAALVGTGCRTTHIVPVTLTESPTPHPDLEDLTLVPWLTLSALTDKQIEGRDYDVYSTFADDDNIPAENRFIIIHEEQTNRDLPTNEYINVLLHNYSRQQPWKGNVMVFKTTTGVEIIDVNEADIPLIKRLVTLYALTIVSLDHYPYITALAMSYEIILSRTI